MTRNSHITSLLMLAVFLSLTFTATQNYWHPLKFVFTFRNDLFRMSRTRAKNSLIQFKMNFKYSTILLISNLMKRSWHKSAFILLRYHMVIDVWRLTHLLVAVDHTSSTSVSIERNNSVTRIFLWGERQKVCFFYLLHTMCDYSVK